MLYSYSQAMNGFSAKLTDDQVKALQGNCFTRFYSIIAFPRSFSTIFTILTVRNWQPFLTRNCPFGRKCSFPFLSRSEMNHCKLLLLYQWKESLFYKMGSLDVHKKFLFLVMEVSSHISGSGLGMKGSMLVSIVFDKSSVQTFTKLE